MAQSISLNVRPRWPDVTDDYVVLFETHSIGNVRLSESGWEWVITIPMALPEWTRGRAATLQDCVKALAGAWAKVLNQTNPERLQRAWDLEKAAEARHVLK